MHEIIVVTKKELWQALRDVRVLVMLFVLPLFELVILGFGVNFDADHIPTVVCDEDGSGTSRRLTEALFGGTTFQRPSGSGPLACGEGLLESGAAAVVVWFRAGLERDVARGVPGQVLAIVDGTDPTRARIAVGALQQLFAARGAALRARVSRPADRGREAAVRIVPRLYYNPTLRSATYIVPGIAAFELLIVTMIVTAMGIARETESGTREQLLVTPLRTGTLLAGKCLPFAAIGLLQITALVTIGAYVFDVPFRGSVPLMLLGSVLYLATTLGSGILVGALSGTQQQAILGGFLFMMPSILLSGFLTPVENMPRWIQTATLVNPSRHYVEILRAVLLKGATLGDVAPQLAALLVLGACALGLSAWRFRAIRG